MKFVNDCKRNRNVFGGVAINDVNFSAVLGVIIKHPIGCKVSDEKILLLNAFSLEVRADTVDLFYDKAVKKLFPFNCTRRLGTNIIHNAIDALNLIANCVRHLF